MSLKIDLSWRRVTKWVGLAVLAVLFLVFIIRVIAFENYYYNEKEGSERATTSNVGAIQPEEELIEEKPTEEEVYEYVVAADRPRYMTIEALGIYNARVLPMGLTDNNALDTPRNIFDVGWYQESGKPGQGGTMIIDGHNGGPHVHGVFKDLPELSEGDIIVIERGDGLKYSYKVYENKEILLSDADQYMSTAAKSPIPGKESVTLITCSGEWSQQRGTYLSRQFVRAVIIE